MAAEPNAVEQAVSRTLRDNLEKVQRTADELHQAVNDLVSACASTRPSNALPSMLRAQTSAASLSATLEVLAKFVTNALQPAMRLPFEPEILRMPSLSAPPASFEQPPPIPSHPIAEDVAWSVPAPAMPDSHAAETLPPVVEPAAAAEVHEAAPAIPPVSATSWETPVASAPEEPMELGTWDAPASAAPVETFDAGSFEPPVAPSQEAMPEFSAELPVEEHSHSAAPSEVEHREAGPVFNLDLLPPEEQELHRRAFRVAKVSMQDIRMLRPEDVRVGRENKDLCTRLRDDIEKAHKEYDRRFQSIQGHPVDYFYDWMVEILGGGDPQALGEYPYPSPVLRR
jgi:uncharacterized damage-inducible protein DinB